MRRKLSILMFCGALFFSMSAFADTVNIIEDSRTVEYSGNISPDTFGIIMVVRSGASVKDNSNMYMLMNTFSDSEGNIEFEFDMPEEKNGKLSDGEYDVYIKEYNGDLTKTMTISYASLASRRAFINAVREVENSDELGSVLTDENNEIVLKAVKCRPDLYTYKTSEIMFSSVESFKGMTWSEFTEMYNTSVAVSNIGGENSSEGLIILNPEFESVKYNSIKDKELTEWITSYLNNEEYMNAEEVLVKYEAANILYKINNSVADRIEENLEKYADKLKIEDADEYKEYMEQKNKSKTNLEITEILSKNPSEDSDDILKALEDAVKKTNNTRKPSSTGGGGGGGSSKVNGYVSTVPSAPTQSTDEKENKDKFADINEAEWAKEAVYALADAGIVNGDENSNFRPYDPVKREEFVKMIVLATDLYDEKAMCAFKDVPEKEWYYTYVASAWENEIISGLSQTKFGTGSKLTRQDMSVICARAKGKLEPVREDNIFADNDEIADYAKEAVSRLYTAGAINGMGENMFVPLGQATRAQCAQLIYNLFLK